MISALILSLLAQNPNCQLPKFTAPKEYQQCVKHTDCTIASDACRTCENIIPVNKVFRNQATILDLEKRLEAGCVKQCTPCDLNLIWLRCIDKVCVAEVLKEPPGEKKADQPKPAEARKVEPAKKVAEPKKTEEPKKAEPATAAPPK